MDRLDVRLIIALQKDARASYAELGRQVGLSAPAVASRLARLEGTGVIRGYKVILANDMIGYALSAFIIIRSAKIEFERAAQILHEIPNFIEIHRVTGDAFIIAKVVAKDMNQLNGIIDSAARIGIPSTAMILSSPNRDDIDPEQGVIG